MIKKDKKIKRAETQYCALDILTQKQFMTMETKETR